jgi:opacity protein-like surface antigen
MRESRLPLLMGFMAWFGLSSQAGADEAPTLGKGRVEFSTSASFSNLKEKDERDSLTVFNLPLRGGYFVTDRLSLEAELLTTRLSSGRETNTGVLFSGSALFHFNTRGRTTPFLLAGLGIGNAVEYLSLAADADTTVTALHGGLGLKTFLGRHAAFRGEYRFSRYSGTKESGVNPFAREDDVGANVHKVFVGISLFFK